MRKYRSQFDRYTLTFSTPSGSGYEDSETGAWITEDTVPSIATGDLQPYNMKSNKQISLPEGFSQKDTKIFSSKAGLSTVEDKGMISADRTQIGGREYYVLAVADWLGGGLSTDYIDYVLGLEALPDRGE